MEKKPKFKFIRRLPDMGGPAPKAVREEIMNRAAGYIEALMADFDKHSREYDRKQKKQGKTKRAIARSSRPSRFNATT